MALSEATRAVWGAYHTPREWRHTRTYQPLKRTEYVEVDPSDWRDTREPLGSAWPHEYTDDGKLRVARDIYGTQRTIVDHRANYTVATAIGELRNNEVAESVNVYRRAAGHYPDDDDIGRIELDIPDAIDEWLVIDDPADEATMLARGFEVVGRYEPGGE